MNTDDRSAIDEFCKLVERDGFKIVTSMGQENATERLVDEYLRGHAPGRRLVVAADNPEVAGINRAILEERRRRGL